MLICCCEQHQCQVAAKVEAVAKEVEAKVVNGAKDVESLAVSARNAASTTAAKVPSVAH